MDQDLELTIQDEAEQRVWFLGVLSRFYQQNVVFSEFFIRCFLATMDCRNLIP